MTVTTATLKEQILEALDQVPDEALLEILGYVQALKPGPNFATTDEVRQAYLDSEKEHEEVYRRLANS
jgi:hypothetical protein